MEDDYCRCRLLESAPSDDAGKHFATRVAAPEGGSQGSSAALINRKGEVLLLWKEDEQVKWTTYSQGSRPTDDKGSAGRLSGPNKPTAFVGADDVFYIVF